MTRQITINISEITETFDVYSLDAAEKAKIIKAQADALKKADAKITRLRAENEKLRAALKPFAADTRWLDGEDDDYLCSSIWFRLGQYRAAAAALKETGDD